MSRMETDFRPVNGDGRTDELALARGWRPRPPSLTPPHDGAARTRRTRRRAIAAGAIVVIAALVVIVDVVLSRRARIARPASPQPAASSGIAGMPGMQMSADGSVTLTPAQRAELGVTFGTAAVRAMATDLRIPGSVTADETRLASVAPRFGGYVERLYANATGQYVRRDEPLAEVYSPDVLAAEQELLVARGIDRAGTSGIPGVAGTPDLTSSARRRLELWGVSEAQIERVLRTGRPSPTVTLYAPASGVITDRKVVRGQGIQAGMELYTIADLSSVWIDAELRQTDAALARVGAPASIEITGYPGRNVAGHVSFIYPTVNETTRTLRARITVPNADGRLKPGMLATVRLTSAAGSALTVPRSAVVQTGERTLVFVDLGGGRLAPRDVVLGRVAGDLAEVVSGVDAGTRVVTSAQFLLDSESNLGEVMHGMIGASATGGE